MVDESALDDLIEDEDLPPPALVEALAPLALRDDPAAPPGYPRGLVLDLVLKTAPIADILSAYKITPEEFKRLTLHPVFVQDLRDTKGKLREEGFSFRVKAAAQAEAYLAQSWKMVHDPDTPANVRADLLKWTTKIAGLDNPQVAGGSPEDLSKVMEQAKNMDMQTLELRVLQIIMKKSPQQVVQSGETYEASQ